MDENDHLLGGDPWRRERGRAITALYEVVVEHRAHGWVLTTPDWEPDEDDMPWVDAARWRPERSS
jgi:hypothetical protein